MVEHDTENTQRSILETVDGDGLAADVDESTASGANRSKRGPADNKRRNSAHTLPKEAIVSSPGVDRQLDYVFEVTGDLEKLEPNEDSGNARDDVVEAGDRVRVEGTVGKGDDRFAFSGDLIDIRAPSEIHLDVRDRNHQRRDQGSRGWRKGYRKYAREYVPAFYESVATKRNLYRCVKYVAETTSFWERLGEKLYLDRAVVTAAYAYPVPNYKKVEKKAWDGILDDMYADMPKKYRRPGRYLAAVPVVVVYLYDGYYNAVAYLRPYGSNYKSYAYVSKNGYHQKRPYRSKSDYRSNTWWMTEDGWGDAGDTEGGILDGVPIGLVE